MNAVIAPIVALLTGLTFAGSALADSSTERRQVDSFSAIAFSLPGDLLLTQGDEIAVRVTATPELLADIITEVDDGVLTIRHSSGVRGFDPDLGEIRVEVTFVSLNGLAMSGSGVAVAGGVESGDLAVSISGSATVDIAALGAQRVDVAISGSGTLVIVDLNTVTLDSSITGSGAVQVGGHADAQSISISGSGNHRAMLLESDEVEAVIAGSGTAEVWATATLDAVIAGSGDVVYRGAPVVSPRISGSGRIRKATDD